VRKEKVPIRRLTCERAFVDLLLLGPLIPDPLRPSSGNWARSGQGIEAFCLGRLLVSACIHNQILCQIWDILDVIHVTYYLETTYDL